MSLTPSTYKMCEKLRKEGFQCSFFLMPCWHIDGKTYLANAENIWKPLQLEREIFFTGIDRNKNHLSFKPQLSQQISQKNASHKIKSTWMWLMVITFVNMRKHHQLIAQILIQRCKDYMTKTKTKKDEFAPMKHKISHLSHSFLELELGFFTNRKNCPTLVMSYDLVVNSLIHLQFPFGNLSCRSLYYMYHR
jgi:hypothetical protein